MKCTFMLCSSGQRPSAQNSLHLVFLGKGAMSHSVACWMTCVSIHSGTSHLVKWILFSVSKRNWLAQVHTVVCDLSDRISHS